MYSRQVLKGKCFGRVDGRIRELEIGTIIKTSNPSLFGDKAETVLEGFLEVATPEPEVVQESGSSEEEELREFILEKSGQAAGGNCKMSTLRKRAKSLGWGE